MAVTSAELARHRDWLASRPGSRRLYLADRDLKGAVLAGIDLRMVGLRNANLAGANFALSTLNGAEIDRCNFEGADLDAIELKSARIVETSLDRVLMPLGHLEGAWLDGGSARGARLGRTRWAKAIVCGVDFGGALLEGASLGEGLFVRCDFRGVNFEGASGAGARFDRCVFDAPAPLEGARYRRCTGLPDAGPTPPPRMPALWEAFVKGLGGPPEVAERTGFGLIDADDEQFAFLIADATLRDLHGLLVFKGLGAEARRIASASPIVRGEEAHPEGCRVARALRALAAEVAARPASTADQVLIADAAVFGALTVEFAPSLEATLAHLTRYLRQAEQLGGSYLSTPAVTIAKAVCRRPPDGRIPDDERRGALAMSEPGTHAGLVEETLTERGFWKVTQSSPGAMTLRHHTGVELVLKLNQGLVESRELLHDEPKAPR